MNELTIPYRREMPVVRIDHIEGKSEEYHAHVGEIVYQTLVDVLNVPKGDRFQVITTLAAIHLKKKA
jgi:hypothetical protein